MSKSTGRNFFAVDATHYVTLAKTFKNFRQDWEYSQKLLQGYNRADRRRFNPEQTQFSSISFQNFWPQGRRPNQRSELSTASCTSAREPHIFLLSSLCAHSPGWSGQWNLQCLTS